MLFKLSNLNSNLVLTLGYLNPTLNNSAQRFKVFRKLLNATDCSSLHLTCLHFIKYMNAQDTYFSVTNL